MNKPEEHIEIAAQRGVELGRQIVPRTDLIAWQQANSEDYYPNDRFKLKQYLMKGSEQ